MQAEINLASLHFNNVTWVTSHNAHANNFLAGENIVKHAATNQEFSIYKQLKEVGVRGLMLDIQYKLGDGLKLVHGHVDYSWLDDTINGEIAPFLDEDPNSIITIDFQTLGDRDLIMKELRVILQQAHGFTNRIFRLADDQWRNHSEWPTIQEMRDADQRIIILSDSKLVQSEALGIMLRRDIVMENHWQKGLDKCYSRYASLEFVEGQPWETRTIKGKSWTRLFTLNHFCCATGIESLQRVSPSRVGGGDNGWGILYPRIEMCAEANGHGKMPNFIAIDWSHIGDAHAVAHYLNFGGRLGTGQRCVTGRDCATSACSKTNHCQCAICEPGCSGCRVDETCVITENGEHGCKNASGVITTNQSNTIKLQGIGLIIFQIVFFRLFIFR